MTFLSDLSWGSMTLVQLEDQAVGALGRVTPRLLLTMQANSTDPGLVGRMLALRVDVTFKNELLGWGEVPASQHEIRSQRSGSLPSLEVPLTPAALAFLQDEVRDDDLSSHAGLQRPVPRHRGSGHPQDGQRRLDPAAQWSG